MLPSRMCYCNFMHSALACLWMEKSGSACFQMDKKILLGFACGNLVAHH